MCAVLLYDFLSKPDEPLPMIVAHILPVKGKCIIGGPPKSNKSWISLNMAIALAKGKPLFEAYAKSSGLPIFQVYKRNRVLILEQEMGEQGSKTRLRSILGVPENTLGMDLYIKTRDVALRMDTQEGKDAIENEVSTVRPDVLIMDPLSKLHGADEDSASAMGGVLRFGDYLIEKYNLSILYLHHTAKPSIDNPRRGGDRLRGSSAIFADVDTAILVNRKSGEDNPEPILELQFEFRRSEPMQPKYLKRRKNGVVSYVGDSFAEAAQ